MKWKTTNFTVLLLFKAIVFAIISTVPLIAVDGPTIDTDTVDFGKPIVPLDGDDFPCFQGTQTSELIWNNLPFILLLCSFEI